MFLVEEEGKKIEVDRRGTNGDLYTLNKDKNRLLIRIPFTR